jgi:hypothetical protein
LGVCVTPAAAWRAVASVRAHPLALAKEAARYALISLLGPDRFLRMTKRSHKLVP